MRPPDDEDIDEAEGSEAEDEDEEIDDDGPWLEKVWDADTVPEEISLSRLESLIFVSEAPITVRKLAKILAMDGRRVRKLLAALTEHYKDRGIVLQEISGGFQFRTHPDNAVVIREVFKLRPLRLSRPALETLSIVAYRQPLTRAEAEDIRGVDCGGVLKFLFEKGLVRVIGRKEEPGRPIIYGTSQTFLELFGLASLSDLPPLHEFSELWDEHKKMVDEQAPLEEGPPEPLPSPPDKEDAPEPSSGEGLEDIARRFAKEPEARDVEKNLEPVEDHLEPDDEKDEP